MTARMTALVALLLSASSTARAQVMIDVTKITCSQFFLAQVSDTRSVAIWLNGYDSGRRNLNVVDVSALKKSVDALLTYCYAHRDTPLIEAYKQVRTGD